MNLATKDIRHDLGRFAMTTIGVGMLLMIVMGMAGMYQGFIVEALLVVDRIGADLWIVQRDTRGPFAELSRVPPNLVHRALAVPGVQSAREFVYHTIQRQHDGTPFRMAVLGLGWPGDTGEWLPLSAGRPLAQNHFEMIADRSLGLRVGERVALGKDTYRVVRGLDFSPRGMRRRSSLMRRARPSAWSGHPGWSVGSAPMSARNSR